MKIGGIVHQVPTDPVNLVENTPPEWGVENTHFRGRTSGLPSRGGPFGGVKKHPKNGLRSAQKAPDTLNQDR